MGHMVTPEITNERRTVSLNEIDGGIDLRASARHGVCTRR